MVWKPCCVMQFFGDDLCCNNGEEALVITNDFDKI
jgi:hypothetical protein